MVIIDYGSSIAKILVIDEAGASLSVLQVPLGLNVTPGPTISQTIEYLLDQARSHGGEEVGKEVYAVGEVASRGLRDQLSAPPIEPEKALASLEMAVVDVGLDFAYVNGAVFRGQVRSEDVLRWLPFSAGSEEISDHLANGRIFRQRVPATERELAIEQAAAREKVRAAASSLESGGAVRAGEVFLTGAAFPQALNPNQALAIALDSLPLSGATRLSLDSDQILVAMGTLRHFRPEIFDSLEIPLRSRIKPLATVISFSGPLRARIDFGLDRSQELGLAGDSLFFLPLDHGDSVTVTIEAGGTKLECEASGGSAGLVIDSRSQPLDRPEVDRRGRSRLSRWRNEINYG